MPSKLKTAKICLLIQGWLLAIFTGFLLLFFILGTFGIGMSENNNSTSIGIIFGVVGLVLAIIAGLGSFLYFYAVHGVEQKKDWGKILSIVLGILSLGNFPVGTILGILILIGLFDEETLAWFGPKEQ